MNTNSCRLSPTDACDSILNHIINCANCALKDENTFHEAMKRLAHEFRELFKSEYCAIGTVMDGIAEDSAIDLQISDEQKSDEQKSKKLVDELESVRSANADDDDTLVSKALKSPLDISSFDKSDFSNLKNFEHYKNILDSGEPENSIVIPIRDDEGDNFGFIQFININDTIDYDRYISPYKEALLGLVQIIINNQKNQEELVKKNNLLKDADFYNLMQEKRDNVDELLDSIMAYFSEQFNAAIVSFRIPLLNGPDKEHLLYLRRVFVHPSIGKDKKDQLIRWYNRERSIKNQKEMKVVEQLRCDNQGKILTSRSDTDFSNYGLNLDNDTLIMPIFRDFGQKCIDPQRNPEEYCDVNGHHDCPYRFIRLYGIFRLRFVNSDLINSNTPSPIYEEIKTRLRYLSKQISLLLNTIVDKHENKSLQVFQNELKNSSFIKIKDFDEHCVDIIKKSVHAKVCSIYRYDDRTQYLSLSATTAKMIHFKTKDKQLYFESKQIQDSCFISIKARNNILTTVYKNPNCCIYAFNIFDNQIHQSPFIEFIKSSRESAMAVPMIKKDGTCAGVVLLLGKAGHNLSISTSYWEHDIKHIEFIVNILTRISESDTERLTFLSQLSHELLAPVTELVYDNDLTVNVAERNPESFSRRQLISKLRENIDKNILFKYIISDTEFIYSSSDKRIDYNIVKQKRPQIILLNAIRLLEKEAHDKGLTITTHIKQMPSLKFDKDRMMQVFLNLLKNAIRYSDSHTTIDVSYDFNDNGFHEISFSNVGIGVLKDEKETIFELFHRGDAAKSKFTRGTGMGLYITRNIMRVHGGDCYVKRLDNPTVFTITLPDYK